MTMDMPLATTPGGPVPRTTYRRRAFTADEYWKMAELGLFRAERVELIGGEVVVVSPQSDLHLMGVDLVRDALQAAFGPNFWVRAQGTLNLAPLSVPDPDVAVVPGARSTHRGRRAVPTTALLIVEVSDTTLWEDRNRKASLYAAAGIADYWILNVPDSRLEVRRDPQPDATQEFGHGYATLQTFQAGDAVAPLAAPNSPVRVDDILPQ